MILLCDKVWHKVQLKLSKANGHQAEVKAHKQHGYVHSGAQTTPEGV